MYSSQVYATRAPSQPATITSLVNLIHGLSSYCGTHTKISSGPDNMARQPDVHPSGRCGIDRQGTQGDFQAVFG